MNVLRSKSLTKQQDVYVPRKEPLRKRMARFRIFYVATIPILIWFFIFRYYPILLQFVLAFTDFRLRSGIWGSEFVGFTNYVEVFTNPDIFRVIINSVRISLLRIIVGFPFPVILAILLFDLQRTWLRKISQTILYIPHFFSWVIIYGIAFMMFSSQGFVNQIIQLLGGSSINFMNSIQWFLPLVIGTGIWRSLGWNTIIYMAALSSISPELYEAARIDGAGPLQRMRYITFPSLKFVMVFLFTLSLGGILHAGGEQLLLFYSPATLSVGDIIDTWVVRNGLGRFMYSLASAVTLFQSITGLILVLVFNKLATKFAGTSIW